MWISQISRRACSILYGMSVVSKMLPLMHSNDLYNIQGMFINYVKQVGEGVCLGAVSGRMCKVKLIAVLQGVKILDFCFRFEFSNQSLSLECLNDVKL